MSKARHFGAAVLITLFTLSLLAVAWSSVAVLTIGRRATVKSWLARSDAYNNVFNIVVESANKAGGNNSELTNNAELQATVHAAFSSDVLQLNTEKVLDGTYNWLEGKVATPDFRIDLAGPKQQLINGLGAYVEKRLNTLPLCASPLPSPDFDPFIASCRPGAVPIALIAQGTKSDLTKRPDFLGNTTITADTLKIKQTNAAGQDEEIPVFSQTQVKRIPLLYRVGRFLPVLLGVVAIGVAVCVVWLYHDHYKGLRRIATSLLIAGVLTGLAMVATVVGNLQLHRQLLGAKTSSAVGQFAGSLVDVIAHDINRILLWFTLGFLLSGAALLLVRKAAGPKAPKQKTSPQPEIDNNPLEPTAPKPKTLIQ